MTSSSEVGHSLRHEMLSVSVAGVQSQTAPENFDAIYERYFDFVWRSARALGVENASLDDVVQEVFLVVHKKLAGFEGRSSIRTWLMGIVINSVRDQRRTIRRKGNNEDLPDELRDESEGPFAHVERKGAAEMFTSILETMSEDQRTVFVLAELEQLTLAEAGEALSLSPNTVASRLRLARKQFDRQVERIRAQDRRLQR